jgi:cbb3-type cytochrome oxidase subunit 3
MSNKFTNLRTTMVAVTLHLLYAIGCLAVAFFWSGLWSLFRSGWLPVDNLEAMGKVMEVREHAWVLLLLAGIFGLAALWSAVRAHGAWLRLPAAMRSARHRAILTLIVGLCFICITVLTALSPDPRGQAGNALAGVLLGAVMAGIGLVCLFALREKYSRTMPPISAPGTTAQTLSQNTSGTM